MKPICVEGYKAFHGAMRIKPKNPLSSSYMLVGDWLYKPDTDCWYSHGRSFPASICTIEKITVGGGDNNENC